MISRFPATGPSLSSLKVVRSALSILCFFYCLSSIRLLADPIGVTILNQTFTASASTQGLSLTCQQTGTTSATCRTQEPTANPNSPAVTYATASASPNSLMVEAAASGGLPQDTFAFASSKVTDTVLITGGQGTGYLNVVFNYDANAIPGSSNADLSVNGQSNQQGSPLFQRPLWLVASFTFGQPFAYSVDVGVTGDNLDEYDEASLELGGARVYATQPSGCPNSPGYQGNSGFGYCDDPNYTSENQAFSQSAVPEPGTVVLFPGAALILLFCRRRAAVLFWRRRAAVAGVPPSRGPWRYTLPNPSCGASHQRHNARMHFPPASQSFPNFRTRDCNNFGEK